MPSLACLMVPLLLALAALGGCGSQPQTSFGAWQPRLLATPEIAALERSMAERVNRDRAGENLSPLRYDERLGDIGRAHSLDMREHAFFAHESPTTGLLEDRLDWAGYLALEARENLAAAGNVDRAEDNLLDSPGHRANIMAASVSHIGIGIVRGDGAGNVDALTITQVFARPTTLDSAEAVAEKVRSMLGAARRGVQRPPLAAHAMLQELAERHVSDLTEGLPEGAVAEVGDEVSAALNARQGHGLSSIRIVAQAVFNAQEFQIPDAAREAASQHVGIATESSKDERGRPRVHILVLLGRVSGAQ